jgi:hypothetical protein
MPSGFLSLGGQAVGSGVIAVKGATLGNVAIAGGIVNNTIHNEVTYATGDLVLYCEQSNGTENGIYIVPASGAALRASSMAPGSDAFGLLIAIRQGGKAGALYQQINSPGVVGANQLAFGLLDRGVLREYVRIGFSAAGATASVGAACPFNSVVDTQNNQGVALNVANGQITVQGGQRRRFVVNHKYSTSVNWYFGQWYNVTLGTWLGSQSEQLAPAQATAERGGSEHVEEFNFATTTTLEYRIANSSGSPVTLSRAGSGGTSPVIGMEVEIERVSVQSFPSGQIAATVDVYATAPQTGVNAGSVLQFPSLVKTGNIPENAGVFTLPPNGVFDLWAGAGQSTTSTILQWRNVTTGALLGVADYDGSGGTPQGICTARIVTGATPVQVRAEFIFVSAAGAAMGANDSNGNRSNWVRINQIGSIPALSNSKLLTLTPASPSGVLNGISFSTSWADPIALSLSASATGFVTSEITPQTSGTSIDAWLNAQSSGAGARLQRWRSFSGNSGSIAIWSSGYSCTIAGYLSVSGSNYRLSGYSHGAAHGLIHIELLN